MEVRRLVKLFKGRLYGFLLKACRSDENKKT